ncbi:ArnT family glycosyltransferase [Pantanalinema sp. GBBB05]|uniref:ArnT family glycosyltransferase n=1 Tax=Pantanalinema sp. GBBB05 TaxID=2604139 RepID=UPI001D4C1B6D|nr:glycosyltransferase family 39 protein [Pantanalinema sp. GBBB05]
MKQIDQIFKQLNPDRVMPQFSNLWTKHPKLIGAGLVFWVLVLAGLLLFWNLGNTGLIDETEPLFAEAARQMTVTGDWITPYFNGDTRFDKPPLIYWLMAIAYKTFGVNEWSARLPSALSALALTFMSGYTLWHFGRSPGRQDAKDTASHDPQALSAPSTLPSSSSSLRPVPTPLLAVLGTTMLILNAYTFGWGRTGHSDMLLSACMGGSLLAFFLGYAQPKPSAQQRWYLVFYVLMAFAVLAKGPVGIVLPGLIIATFLLYVDNGWTVLRELKLLRGGLIVLLIAVPWYVLVTLANGDAFIDAFFGYHNFERFTMVVNRHKEPWYFHILIVLAGFLPWSVYLPAAIVRLRPFQRQSWQEQPRSQHLGLFALSWFWVVLLFFTVASTKVVSYTLPLVPAAAILVAQLWGQDWSEPGRRSRLVWSQCLNSGVLVALAIVLFKSPNWLDEDAAMPKLGLRLQESGLPMLGSLILLGTALTIAGLLLWRRRWIWTANLLGFLMFLMLVVHPMLLIVDTERQLPLRQLAQVAVQAERPKERILMVGFEKPSLVFYTQGRVRYFFRASRVEGYLERRMLDSDLMSGALIIAMPKMLEQTGLSPDQYQELARAGAYQLVRVTPESLKG